MAAGHLCGTAGQHVRATKGPPATPPPPPGKLGGGATTGTRCIPGGTTVAGGCTGEGAGIVGGGAGGGAGIAGGGPGFCASWAAIRTLSAFDSLIAFSKAAPALPLALRGMYERPVVGCPSYLASGSSHLCGCIAGAPGFAALWAVRALWIMSHILSRLWQPFFAISSHYILTFRRLKSLLYCN